MKLRAAFALCLIVGCTSEGDDDDEGGAVCGNAACEAGESSLTCPMDCTAASCSPANPSSCGGETICINQQCVPAFGRNYIFTVTTGTFTQFDDTGVPWDAGGGLPDPFVILRINGNAYTTTTVDDTLTPSWNYATPPVIVPGGTVLLVDVYDEDLTVDDPAWACQANPLSADLLRGGGLTCSGSGALANARVSLTVRPN